MTGNEQPATSNGFAVTTEPTALKLCRPRNVEECLVERGKREVEDDREREGEGEGRGEEKELFVYVYV